MHTNRRPNSVALRLPRITYIVARSYPENIIGCENRLPWSLPTDLSNFRKVTSGHAIIMGRRTLESIGRALPKRKNIVLSRSSSDVPDGVVVVNTIEDALWEADVYTILNSKKEFFVIGGDQIYKLFEDFCQKIILTEVFSDKIVGDSHFNMKFDKREWANRSEVDYSAGDRVENGVVKHNQYPFRITTYERRDAIARTLSVRDFLTKFQFQNDFDPADLLDQIHTSYFVEEEVQKSLFDGLADTR